MKPPPAFHRQLAAAATSLMSCRPQCGDTVLSPLAAKGGSLLPPRRYWRLYFVSRQYARAGLTYFVCQRITFGDAAGSSRRGGVS